MILSILLAVMIGEILIIVLFKSIGFNQRLQPTQHETDLRLTYKRYKELYPHSTISYPEYKRLQKESAYKKAICSTRIKRMVR